MRPCREHTEYSFTCFGCYLSQPCDECEQVATHNGTSTLTGSRGKFCDEHTDFDDHARARND